MGDLSRIQNLVNGTIATGHVRLMPRGVLYYADQLLRGTVRFAKRSGNEISMLNPDNTFLTTAAAAANNKLMNVSGPSPWIGMGSLISIGPGLEFVEVADIAQNILIFTANLENDYASGTPILLHSVPSQMVVSASMGDITVTVNSLYELGNGDVFAYLQNQSLLTSITQSTVIQATFNGTTGNPEFPFQYTLTLETPLLTNLLTNSPVYIRAYPAYFGSGVQVPNSITSTDPLGPLLLDHMSGKMLEGKNFIETFSIAALDRLGNAIIGNPNALMTVQKNFPLSNRPVHQHTPMFWDLGEGDMRMTPNTVMLKVASRVKQTDSFEVQTVSVGHTYGFTMSGNVIAYTATALDDFHSVLTGLSDNIAHVFPNNSPVTTDVSGNDVGSVLTLTSATAGQDIVYTSIDSFLSHANVVANDPTGYFVAGTKFTPNLVPGTTWQILVTASESATLNFIFNPYPLVSFNVPSSISTPIVIGVPSGSDPITSIEINAVTSSGQGQITLTDWNPTNAVVTQFDYAIVVQATGIATWQSSGLVVKPIFLSSDLLRVYYDSGVNYDSGKVYF